MSQDPDRLASAVDAACRTLAALGMAPDDEEFLAVKAYYRVFGPMQQALLDWDLADVQPEHAPDFGQAP